MTDRRDDFVVDRQVIENAVTGPPGLDISGINQTQADAALYERARERWTVALDERDRLNEENKQLREVRQAAEKLLWRVRCEVTNNLFGTDTWAEGHPCRCPACQEAVALHDALGNPAQQPNLHIP